MEAEERDYSDSLLERAELIKFEVFKRTSNAS